MKSGHRLDDIQDFEPETLETLRRELSVTTAEEFLDLSSRYKDEMARLLGVEPRAVDRYASAAATAVGADTAATILEPPADPYPYRTGHDAPTSAGGTFWEKD